MTVEPGAGAPAGGSGKTRASDADRERAVEAVSAAFAEGRLTKEEHSMRVQRAYGSLTYAELAALSADLPAGPPGPLPPPQPQPFRGPTRWRSPPWYAGSSRCCRPRSPRSSWASGRAASSGGRASAAARSPRPGWSWACSG
jgi:hypothetical protein